MSDLQNEGPQGAAAVLPNPYVGPRSFQTGEALYGRAQEARDVLGLLIAERIVLLHSPSGAGKTSLVQAALIPQLREHEFNVLPVMRVSLEPPPRPPTTDHRPPTVPMLMGRRSSVISRRSSATATS